MVPKKTIRKYASINMQIFENENILTPTVKFCGHLEVQSVYSGVIREQFSTGNTT